MSKKTEIKLDKKEKRKKTIYQTTKLIVSISATILAIFWGWLEFDISIKPLMSDEGVNIIFKISLALYYFSWIFGTAADMRDEDYTLNIYPNNNKLSLSSIGAIVFLVLLFGFLCWANTYKLFITALTILLVYNIISWRFLIHFVKITLDKNKKNVINEFDIEYQLVLEEYLMGNWQWKRFAYGGFVIGIINLIIFTNSQFVIASKLESSPQFIVSVCLLFYVITFELWIWYKRLIRILSYKLFDILDDKYLLKLRK